MVDAFERLSAALAGEYRLESELGQGGMARVYRAEDLQHGRRVALKLLRPELAAMLGVDRFLAEVKIMAGLQHPHLLHVARRRIGIDPDLQRWFTPPSSGRSPT
jgi:serine/threonine-protein kinase